MIAISFSRNNKGGNVILCVLEHGDKQNNKNLFISEIFYYNVCRHTNKQSIVTNKFNNIYFKYRDYICFCYIIYNIINFKGIQKIVYVKGNVVSNKYELLIFLISSLFIILMKCVGVFPIYTCAAFV